MRYKSKTKGKHLTVTGDVVLTRFLSRREERRDVEMGIRQAGDVRCLSDACMHSGDNKITDFISIVYNTTQDNAT